ncbi:hypothetical protein Tco_0693169 [Tanacetum coccineum]
MEYFDLWDSCVIKSLKLPKSGNQLRFLIDRVPSGRTSNALSIPRRFSALMFSYLIASVWASRIYDALLPDLDGMHHSKQQNHRSLLVMQRLELYKVFVLAIGKLALGLLPISTFCFSRRCPILNCFYLGGVNVSSLTINYMPKKLHDTNPEITFGEICPTSRILDRRKLSEDKMPPKRTSTSEAPAMTQAAIRKLVADSVTAALEAQAANMANTDNTTRPREAPVARKCSYKEFMSCQPINFKEWFIFVKDKSEGLQKRTGTENLESVTSILNAATSEAKTSVRNIVILVSGRPNMVPAWLEQLVSPVTLSEEGLVRGLAMKMGYWSHNIDMNIWRVIQNGNSLKRTGRDRDGRVIILPPMTADEHIVFKGNPKADIYPFASVYS